ARLGEPAGGQYDSVPQNRVGPEDRRESSARRDREARAEDASTPPPPDPPARRPTSPCRPVTNTSSSGSFKASEPTAIATAPRCSAWKASTLSIGSPKPGAPAQTRTAFWMTNDATNASPAAPTPRSPNAGVGIGPLAATAALAGTDWDSTALSP